MTDQPQQPDIHQQLKDILASCKWSEPGSISDTVALEQLAALISQTVSSVIGEDDTSMTRTLENPSWDDMRAQASLLGQNQLRSEQRATAQRLLGKAEL